MRLERRVLGYLTVVMTAISVLLIAGTSAAILLSANTTDRSHTLAAVREVSCELARERADLAGNAMDWAARDAGHGSADDSYADFVRGNLPANNMRNLDINVVGVYDRQGGLLFSRKVATLSVKSTTSPQVGRLLMSSPALNVGSGLVNVVSGVVELPDGRFMLAAAAPIARIEQGRTALVGTLLFGRVLDAARLGRLSEETEHPVVIRRAPTLSGRSEGTGIVVQGGGSASLDGSADLLGPGGNAVARLSVTTERTARSNGVFTLMLMSVGLLLTQLGSVFILRYGLRGIVLDRIMTLDKQVDRVRRSGHTEPVLVGGDDELGSLGANIDRMLQSLDRSHAELQRTHDELETRVEDRTAQLRSVILELEEQIHGRCTAEEERAASEARCRLLIDNLTDTVFTLDEQWLLTFVSPGVEWTFGHTPDHLVGKGVTTLLAASSAVSLERQLRRGLPNGVTVLNLEALTSEGQPLDIEMVLSQLDGRIGAVQGIIRDVTAQRRYEEELLHIASHDFLTGLVNRRRFEEDLERVLASTERHGTEGAVLWIDLDNFKDVNDTLGHHAGDELLVAIARALRASVHAECVLARLHGDEFAVLLPAATREEAREAGDRLLAEIAKVHLLLEDRVVHVHGSMGIVMFPENGHGIDELLARADTAMYCAKQLGRSRSVFFTPEEGLRAISSGWRSRAGRRDRTS